MSYYKRQSIKSNISTITAFDEGLFKGLLSSTHWVEFPFSYEGSFAFYSHRAGYFPLKYYDGYILIPFFYRNDKYSILRPIGKWNVKTVINLAEYLNSISKQQVPLLKLTYYQYKDLQKFKEFHPLSVSKNLQDIEDDRYNQLVISIDKLLLGTEDKKGIIKGYYPHYKYLRRAIRLFENEYKATFRIEKLAESHLTQVLEIINKWKQNFKQRYDRDNFESKDDDRTKITLPNDDEYLIRPYKCILHRFSKNNDYRYYFGYVAFIENSPVGFIFLGRTSRDCVGLYANLALLNYPHLSYYLIYRIAKYLKKLEINYINLGGQETNMLRRFFLRFNPFELYEDERRSYDGEYST